MAGMLGREQTPELTATDEQRKKILISY